MILILVAFIYVMTREEPFEALLRRYRGLLFSLCRRYTRRGTTVEDLMQDASVALFRSSERLLAMATGVQQAALVWKIARNAMVDTIRRTPEMDAIAEEWEAEAEERREHDELYERIALLPEPDRTVVTMHLEGYSYEEIGQATQMSEKNVSVRLVRIREKLRKNYI